MSNEIDQLSQAARNGDIATLQRLVALKPDAQRLKVAIQWAVSHGHTEVVRFLRERVDLSDGDCEMFRWAITKKNAKCARLLIPDTHPNAPRGYIYVQHIIGGPGSDAEKTELLHLCTQVFDVTHDNSRAFRLAVMCKAQYAIDLLFPLSDVKVALDILRELGGRIDTDLLDTLEARRQKDLLAQHTGKSHPTLIRKI